jgi:AraC-like DNA-binding protein
MYFEGHRDSRAYYNENQDNRCVAHFHRSTEIMLVTKGEKHVEVNGKAYTLHAGDVLFSPPYAVHIYSPTTTSLQTIVTLLPEYCERFERFCESLEPASHVIHDDGRIRELIDALISADNPFLKEGASVMLIGEFIKRSEFRPINKKNALNLKQIADYIAEHYAENLTLTTIAKQFGYAPTYFSSLFKKNFCMSLPQYVNTIRIQKSLPLLKTHAVSSVYFLCGFNSPQQYFLQFKKVLGCTPYEYLKGKR